VIALWEQVDGAELGGGDLLLVGARRQAGDGVEVDGEPGGRQRGRVLGERVEQGAAARPRVTTV
jgi:hypothetical protein